MSVRTLGVDLNMAWDFPPVVNNNSCNRQDRECNTHYSTLVPIEVRYIYIKWKSDIDARFLGLLATNERPSCGQSPVSVAILGVVETLDYLRI